MTDDERVPPKRVRLEKLQEVHVPDLRQVDHACAEQYWALGFDAAEVPVRTAGDFYHLPRHHAVRVAEADYKVCGFSAFRDEAPGVAYLEDVSVHPEYQRFGIGRKLVEHVFEEARAANLSQVVLRVWDKAEWAKAFYVSLGFRPIGDDAPAKVREWLALKTEGGRPFLRPGESAWWVNIPAAAPEEEEPEDEDDQELSDGAGDDDAPS